MRLPSIAPRSLMLSSSSGEYLNIIDLQDRVAAHLRALHCGEDGGRRHLLVGSPPRNTAEKTSRSV
jgi:hypothetical protein